MLEHALAYARSNFDAAMAALVEELRIPSVSTLTEYSTEVRRNAIWLEDQMRRAGLTTSIVNVPHGRHPIVRAELVINSALPTLTIYGHYDVQPADPLAEWDSAPFEPAVRDGRIFARGVADNKANHMAALFAVASCVASGGMPINVRFLIEGEEESGGEAIRHYVRAHAPDLATDWILIWDGGFSDEGDPALECGLRGLLYLDIRAFGASGDLHSGVFGGIAPNPLNTLVWALAALKGRDGRVTIPGFYDDVRAPRAQELLMWQRGPDFEQKLKSITQSPALEGEADYPVTQRMWTRPTLDIHGLSGGFAGEGMKTIIPAACSAKLSMRLVPDQDPVRILAAVEDHLHRLETPGVRFEILTVASARPLVLDGGPAATTALSEAFREAFGRSVQLIRSGGTIPVAIDLAESLGVPMLMSGLPEADCRSHSPNENVRIEQYRLGIEALIRFFYGLAHAPREIQELDRPAASSSS